MGEDIKINEVQQANDAAYITVILEDGTLGKIAKADLVDLIRINMPTATHEYKGLMDTSDLKNLSGLISDNDNVNADNLPNGFLPLSSGKLQRIQLSSCIWLYSYNNHRFCGISNVR